MTEDQFAEVGRQLTSPASLHAFLLQYNWDDGVEIPRWIVNHPLCDQGTALMTYWLAGPRFFYQFRNRSEVPAHSLDVYDLVRDIEQRYLRGQYASNTILFNPRHDWQAGMGGLDWTQQDADLVQECDIPAIMYEPNIRDEKWEAMGKPIMPVKHPRPLAEIDVDEIADEVDKE